jgi:hypothetical protein
LFRLREIATNATASGEKHDRDNGKTNPLDHRTSRTKPEPIPSNAALSMFHGQNAISVVFSRQSRQSRPFQTHPQILLIPLWITFAKALRA